jgi:hypothetical protein
MFLQQKGRIHFIFMHFWQPCQSFLLRRCNFLIRHPAHPALIVGDSQSLATARVEPLFSWPAIYGRAAGLQHPIRFELPVQSRLNDESLQHPISAAAAPACPRTADRSKSDSASDSALVARPLRRGGPESYLAYPKG